ncbi:MAG: M56 family peptidase, partial [Muricauda sp.]|nr:M56 family peptidase [Allomuricauda sp.]
MEALLIYFLKSALIMGGFLAVYHLFLKRETHFLENRLFLVAGLLISLVFPWIKIQNTVLVDKPLVISVNGTNNT